MNDRFLPVLRGSTSPSPQGLAASTVMLPPSSVRPWNWWPTSRAAAALPALRFQSDTFSAPSGVKIVPSADWFLRTCGPYANRTGRQVLP